MPPKIKVTKDEIINNAIEIVRKDGEQSINARTIATQLNCSTQPIFSNFATMDDLRLAVTQKAYFAPAKVAFFFLKQFTEQSHSRPPCLEYCQYRANASERQCLNLSENGCLCPIA